MGYRRGYDCDICGFPTEHEDEMVGLENNGKCDVKEIGCDQADFHICMACARVIGNAVQERDSRKTTVT